MLASLVGDETGSLTQCVDYYLRHERRPSFEVVISHLIGETNDQVDKIKTSSNY